MRIIFSFSLFLPWAAWSASWQQLSVTGQTPGNLAWATACYVNSWKTLFQFGNGNGPTEDKYTCFKSQNTGGLGYLNTEYTFDYPTKAWKLIRPDHDVVDYSSYIETRRMNDAIAWPAVWPAEPAGRDNHQMVYDPVLNKVYLLGGTCHGDFFEYDIDTRTWFLLSTKGLYTDLPLLPVTNREYKGVSVIGEVFNCAMAFDYLNQRVIIYGGRVGPQCPAFGRTYAFDCKNPKTTQRWVRIAQIGPSPPPVMEMGENNAIYDPVGQKMVWFGGGTGDCGETALSETWELDCKTDAWSKANTPVSPPARTFPNLAYDPYHRKVFMQGGSSGGNDTWVYDPAAQTWEKILTNGPANQRFSVGSYDLENRRFIHYTADAETWALTYEDGPEFPLVPYPGIAAERQPENARWSPLSVSPNPAASAVRISLTGARNTAIYDSRGRLIQSIPAGAGKAGVREFVWRPAGLSAGVYLLKGVAGRRVYTRKITLL